MSNDIKIGIIGLGTVGTGVAKALLEKRRLFERQVGRPLRLVRLCDRNIRRKRPFQTPAGSLTTDADAIIRDPSIQIVIELIGGLQPAKRLMLEAMRRGKHVVTANKALLAESGNELFAAAERHGADLYFEASVGGGIPIIKALREGLVANDLNTIIGIVNGTSNYVLTQMRTEHLSFHEAVHEAKRHGYAERNPSLDVDGHDAAHKLAILAWLGFGVRVPLARIYTEGISRVSPADIHYAQELGYCIKPLAIAKQVGQELEMRVHPTLLQTSHLLANVHGVYNAIYVHGDLVGAQVFYGRGAGQNPATSAVLSDVIDVARNIAQGRPKHIRPVRQNPRALRLRRMDGVATRYYLRCMAIDKPGVLARIAHILGRHHISIASVHQKERKTARVVPVVMMTHEAREAHLRAAVATIDHLAMVKSPTVVLRTEEPRAK